LTATTARRRAWENTMCEGAPQSGLRHAAVFYRGWQEYQAAAVDFIRAALSRDEPVLVAVPGQTVSLLRAALGSDRSRVLVTDMTQLGRNPAGIIPAVRAFADRRPGTPFSYLGEPAWPGRTPPELLEVTKHEALVNLAFARTRASILCPYDEAGLPASVLSDAEHTHPLLAAHGSSKPSPGYLGPDRLPRRCERPLPDPPADAEVLPYDSGLRRVRALVESEAIRAGLGGSRTSDLVLAVSELAANTLRHTPAGGVLHVWSTSEEAICQTHDRGWIMDPLAGRRRPQPERPGGQGLWVVNQICDLVEVRTGNTGTTVRIHMRLRPETAVPPGGAGHRWAGRAPALPR
jgi:anti-sigma regulatory factor (Ser/Thr protein kinase)